MNIVRSAILRLLFPLCLAATISTASAAPPAKSAEDRYIAARDAAIEKISAIYDAGNADEAARKAEDAASADLEAQMRAILNEPSREGFGLAKLSIDTFAKATKVSASSTGCASTPSPARTVRRPARTAPTANMSSRRRTSSSPRRRCSNAGCAPTGIGGTRAPATCRSRSARH